VQHRGDDDLLFSDGNRNIGELLVTLRCALGFSWSVDVTGLRPIRRAAASETLTDPRSEYSRMVTRCFDSSGQHPCAASLKLETPASSRIFFISSAVSPVALSSVIPNVTALLIMKLVYIDRFLVGHPTAGDPLLEKVTTTSRCPHL
jgi:hypothetical protein